MTRGETCDCRQVVGLECVAKAYDEAKKQDGAHEWRASLVQQSDRNDARALSRQLRYSVKVTTRRYLLASGDDLAKPDALTPQRIS
jgi:hypothetical protein